MSLMFLIQVELCIIHFIMCPIVLFSAEELGILKHIDLSFRKVIVSLSSRKARGRTNVWCFSVSLHQLHSPIGPFHKTVKLMWFLVPLLPRIEINPWKRLQFVLIGSYPHSWANHFAYRVGCMLMSQLGSHVHSWSARDLDLDGQPTNWKGTVPQRKQGCCY